MIRIIGIHFVAVSGGICAVLIALLVCRVSLSRHRIGLCMQSLDITQP